MATIQTFVVCDNSTAANYVSWASAVSNALRTFGWTNSSDTGQLNGAGAGNWGSVTTVPGSGAFYYEIFQPGDGLQNWYLKLEYGNASGSSNSPTFRLTLSTSTNGSGTSTGFLIGPFIPSFNNYTALSSSTTYECDFSGDAGRICVMMWRNGINHCQQIFCIQRSLDVNSSPTSSYITIWYNGYTVDGENNSQQSLVFGVGPATNLTQRGNLFQGCWCVPFCYFTNNASNSGMFNGSVPFSTCYPVVGYYGYPCTCVGMACYADLVITEGIPFTLLVNGHTHTYMPSGIGVFNTNPDNTETSPAFTCMEFD